MAIGSKTWRAATALALCGATFGCNAVLDNPPGELAASDGGTADAGADSSGVALPGPDAAIAIAPGSEDAASPADVWTPPLDAATVAPVDAAAVLSCAFGSKACSGACVSADDPLYGCGPTACAACSLLHATPACAGGACAIGACEAGYADCDQDPTNGCETDLSQASHCGTCNAVCPASAPDCSPTSAGFACVTGCSGGAPTLCGTQCTSTDSSLDDCGGCGIACSAVANGTTSCTAGVCGFQCEADFHACGSACASDVSTDTCGASCAPCPAPANAIATCDGTQCGMTCAPNFADCNGHAADGCETNLLGDPADCGACGVSCGAGTCSSGTCVAPAPPPVDASTPPVVDAGHSPSDDAGAPPPDAAVSSPDATTTSMDAAAAEAG